MPESASNGALAAIMSADVVGYSRLMGADEAGTLSALKELRANLIDPTHHRISRPYGQAHGRWGID